MAISGEPEHKDESVPNHMVLRGRMVGHADQYWVDCECGFHAEGSEPHVREALKEHMEEVKRGTH